MGHQSKQTSPYPFVKKYPSSLDRFFYRTYNWFENRLWPISPLLFAASTGSLIGYQLKRSNQSDLSEIAKLIGTSCGITYLSTFFIRQFLKWFYFSYKGYLFENPKKPSLYTKLWAITRSILAKVAPVQLSSCDLLLPNLPVPKLKDTVEKYVNSMKNILSEEEHAELKELAALFVKNEGKKLQRYTWIWSLFNENYVTPLWEKYIYQAGRYPLLINSSVAQCTMYGRTEKTQAYQLARLIYIENLANLALDRQKYMAVGNGIMSTRHYRNIYNGCRIPGKTYDNFEWNKPSKHAILILDGTFYKIDVCDERRTLYTVDQLTKIIDEVLNRQDRNEGSLTKIASLTHDERTSWYENRKKFFLENQNNKPLLDLIEKAFIIVTANQDTWDTTTPADLSKYMKDMLAGNGKNRWADKTMNYEIDKNGRGGATGEHSPCDGAELDHLCENFLNLDVQIMECPSIEEQKNIAFITENDRKQLKLAEKLDFKLVDGMSEQIEKCYNNHIKAKNDLDLYSLAFLEFGKGRIKKCGVSPDGFIQMALQLAIYKDQGKFVLTYEPGSVRFFANSRTETLRPVTDDSCKFVLSMLDSNVKNEEKIQLLRKACESHVRNCKNVMSGNGFDRHLFVLCVMAKAFGYDSKFLEHYSSQKWILSTSNIPNMTNSIDEDKSQDTICLGASFGAVAQNGYGVCYRFAGNQAIMLHITSYHSATNTDSTRFATNLRESIHAIANLFADNNNEKS